MTGDLRTLEDLRHAFEHPPVVPDPTLVDLEGAHQTAHHRQRRTTILVATTALTLASVLALVVAGPWAAVRTAPVTPGPSPTDQPGFPACDPDDFTHAGAKGPQDSDGVSWLTTFTHVGRICEFSQPPAIITDSGADLRLTWVSNNPDGWSRGWSPVVVPPLKVLQLVVVADATPCNGADTPPAKFHTLLSLVSGGAELDLGQLQVWSCDNELYLQARVAPSAPIDTWTAFQPIYGFPGEQRDPPPVDPETAPDCLPGYFETERAFGPRETDTGQAFMMRFHNHALGCVMREEPRLIAEVGVLSSARWLHDGEPGWVPLVVEAGDVVQLMFLTDLTSCSEPTNVIGGMRLEWGGSLRPFWTLDVPTCDGVLWLDASAGVRLSDGVWFSWDWGGNTPVAPKS